MKERIFGWIVVTIFISLIWYGIAELIKLSM
jgi:capsule polysaccharide export protein KpsE/RkpR